MDNYLYDLIKTALANPKFPYEKGDTYISEALNSVKKFYEENSQQGGNGGFNSGHRRPDMS